MEISFRSGDQTSQTFPRQNKWLYRGHGLCKVISLSLRLEILVETFCKFLQVYMLGVVSDVFMGKKRMRVRVTTGYLYVVIHGYIKI